MAIWLQWKLIEIINICSHNTRTTQWEDPRKTINAQPSLTHSAESLLVRSQQQQIRQQQQQQLQQTSKL